jgi:hypothetical protein
MPHLINIKLEIYVFMAIIEKLHFNLSRDETSYITPFSISF